MASWLLAARPTFDRGGRRQARFALVQFSAGRVPLAGRLTERSSGTGLAAGHRTGRELLVAADRWYAEAGPGERVEFAATAHVPLSCSTSSAVSSRGRVAEAVFAASARHRRPARHADPNQLDHPSVFAGWSGHMMAGLVAAARCDRLTGLRRISIERRDRAVMRFPLIAKNQLANILRTQVGQTMAEVSHGA